MSKPSFKDIPYNATQETLSYEAWIKVFLPVDQTGRFSDVLDASNLATVARI